jgi:hypothetical protein
LNDETNDVSAETNETYEPPAVEDLESSDGPIVTGAGGTSQLG